jgi:hypothetical protein
MHRLHLETFGNIHALPLLHYRMEFAWLVREAFRRVRPDCIAVELPPTLEEGVVRAVTRLPQISVVTYRSGDDTVFLLIEPADPLVEGCRLAIENGIPLKLVDLDLDSYPPHREALPDSYAVHRIGLGAYYDAFRRSTCGEPATEDLRREQGMAHRLRELAAKHERILFLCGMTHLERVKELFRGETAVPLERVRRRDPSVVNLHPDSCREILGEEPFLSALYELLRGELPPEPPEGGNRMRKSFGALELLAGGKREASEEEILTQALHRAVRHAADRAGFPDRQRILYQLFHEAARHYRQETGERLHHWQRRLFFRYVRNLALLEGGLLPDLFQTVTAARGCIDDNFAYACWRLAGFYPWQRESAEVPTLRLRPEDLMHGSRTVRFRPRSKQREKGLSGLKFLNRRKEKRAGEWLDGFDDPSVCSYPPEDLAIENYGRFLKKKGAKLLSEEQSRVEPFTASLLDGIDMRETLRNIHEGKLYVRENRLVKGEAGSVVAIFDEDRGGKYPYLMTWLGEHEQESDMAFYATNPAENVVGPGICRCEYGGFLLSYPPRRMADVWTDRDYQFARSRSEILLLAALDYSRDPVVIFVAPRPPRSVFRRIAASLEKRIIYIPLGSLSPVTVKKLRVFHVLFGRDKRKIAQDYVW